MEKDVNSSKALVDGFSEATGTGMSVSLSTVETGHVHYYCFGGSPSLFFFSLSS